MYTIKLDGQLFWDPRVEELRILEPKVKLEVNRAGSLTFSVTPSHPLYAQIKKLKSIVEVFKDGVLIFRGRPLDDELDSWNIKSVICEGDLAIFNDSIVRPYEFTGTISDYLTMFISNHNSQVETGKRFTLGTVTVTDPNDYIIRASSDYPKTWSEMEDKLLKILGGYLVIRRDGTTNYLDYLADSNKSSLQVIQLGENLLKVNQERRGEDIATAIIPIGAEIENEDGTKTRVDIKSVNNNVDYVYNQEAVNEYGWIFKKVEFKDVTQPANLLTKANQALAESILLLNTIQLTAVDLSMIDINIDDFKIFEYVEVISAAHQLDDMYLIRKMELDLMNPENNTITVGAEFASFTEKQFQTDKQIVIVSQDVVKNSEKYTNEQVTQISTELIKTIEETNSGFRQEVKETYTSQTELNTYREEVSLALENTAKEFNLTFKDLTEQISNNQGEVDNEFQEIKKYIRFVNGNIVLGESTNPVTLTIENNRIFMAVGGVQVSYWEVDETGANPPKFYVTDGEFLNSLRLGNFAFTPRSNGSLDFGRVV